MYAVMMLEDHKPSLRCVVSVNKIVQKKSVPQPSLDVDVLGNVVRPDVD